MLEGIYIIYMEYNICAAHKYAALLCRTNFINMNLQIEIKMCMDVIYIIIRIISHFINFNILSIIMEYNYIYV